VAIHISGPNDSLQYFKAFSQYMYAKKLVEIKQPAEAMPYIFQAILWDSSQPKYYALAIECLFNQTRFTETIHVSNAVLKKFPNEPSALYFRASSYLSISKVKEALRDIHAILEDFPDHKETIDLLRTAESISGLIHQNPFRKAQDCD